VFLAAGLGLGAIGYLVSENNILTTLLYVAAALLAVVALLACRSQRIIIRSTVGVIDIQCVDQSDEGEGFVNSLRVLLPVRK
jgi:hypothetical protein